MVSLYLKSLLFYSLVIFHISFEFSNSLTEVIEFFFFFLYNLIRIKGENHERRKGNFK